MFSLFFTRAPDSLLSLPLKRPHRFTPVPSLCQSATSGSAAPLAHPRQFPPLSGSRGQTGKGHLYPELFLQSEHTEPLCSPCPPPSPPCAFTQTHPLPATSYIYLRHSGNKLKTRSFASAATQTLFNIALLTGGRKGRNYVTQQNVLHKPFFVIIFCNRCVV